MDPGRLSIAGHNDTLSNAPSLRLALVITTDDNDYRWLRIPCSSWTISYSAVMFHLTLANPTHGLLTSKASTSAIFVSRRIIRYRIPFCPHSHRSHQHLWSSHRQYRNHRSRQPVSVIWAIRTENIMSSSSSPSHLPTPLLTVSLPSPVRFWLHFL